MATPTDEQRAIFAVEISAQLGMLHAGSDLPTLVLTDLRNKLAELQAQIGTWNVVWGPAIWRIDPTGFSDNVMFVAQNADTQQYVVAINGTNLLSPFDWKVEDGAVKETVPWRFGQAPAGAVISLGAAVGTSILLANPASEGTPNAGVTLEGFLGSESKAGALDVVVSGHSLGGALSPVVAQFLADTQSAWDQSGASKISTMPTAGPTPGNATFAAYANATVDQQGFFNSLDVVPHTWALGDLQQIPTIYVPDLPENPEIVNVVAGAEAMVQGIDYQPMNRTELTGTFDPNKNRPSALESFLLQLIHQHTTAYFDLFGLDDEDLLAAAALASNKALASFAAALQRTGATIPPMTIAAQPTKPYAFGRHTFEIPADADASRVDQAMAAFEARFGAAR